AIAAEALFAPVNPAMIKGLRVRVKAKRGTATANRPSPLADMPVAHQSRLNATPSERRRMRTALPLLGAPTVPDEPEAARFTDAKLHYLPTTLDALTSPLLGGPAGHLRVAEPRTTMGLARLTPRSTGASVLSPSRVG